MGIKGGLMNLKDALVSQVQKRTDIRKMTAYLDWRFIGGLFTLALFFNLIMIGIYSLFFFCWSKLFWKEASCCPSSKTRCQPSLIKKDLEASYHPKFVLSYPEYLDI